MTKQEFIDTCKELELKGYKKNFKYDEPINDDGTHYLYKVIEYADDKYADRVPEESMYSIEPVIMFSRDTEERIDLHLHYPKHTIEYIEKKAVKFGEWCKQNME